MPNNTFTNLKTLRYVDRIYFAALKFIPWVFLPLGLGCWRRCLESAITTENQSRRRLAIAGLDDDGQSVFLDGGCTLYIAFNGGWVLSVISLLIRCLSSYLFALASPCNMEHVRHRYTHIPIQYLILYYNITH